MQTSLSSKRSRASSRSAPAPLIPDLCEIVAERCARSLHRFVVEAWPIIEPGSPFVDGWHIQAICDHLQAVTRGQVRDLLINMPPRHAKSSIVSVLWPAWEWIEAPSRQFLTASYAMNLALRDASKSRRLIESPWYRLHFGERFRLTDDQNQKRRYENDRNGHRVATSVDAGATGEGGDRILCDDPHNAKQSESDAVRKGAVEWWRSTMSTRGNDPKTVGRVVVGQRVHAADLSGYLLEEGGWTHLSLPAEYEKKFHCSTALPWTDPRKDEGELLWPQRFDRPAVEKLKKSLGSYGAAGQLQQRPAPAEGGIFKRSWFRYYYADSPNEDERLPEIFDRVVASYDLAFKKTKDSDFVAGFIIGTKGARRYLLDHFKQRLSYTETRRKILEMHRDWRPDQTWVEDKANGPAIMDELHALIEGLTPVEPQGGKEARAHAASPGVEAGQVYLPAGAAWVDGFLTSVTQFPNAAHDDDVDALTQGLIALKEPEFAFE